MSGLSLDNLVIPRFSMFLADQKYEYYKKQLGRWWTLFTLSGIALFLYLVPAGVYNYFCYLFVGNSDKVISVYWPIALVLVALTLICGITGATIYFVKVRGNKVSMAGHPRNDKQGREAFALLHPVVQNFNGILDWYLTCPSRGLPNDYVEAKLNLVTQEHEFLSETIDLFALGGYEKVMARMKDYLEFEQMHTRLVRKYLL